MRDIDPNQVVFTLNARCRDCYRCLRVCPVKAIRMHNGQACVDEQRCIACGTCIRECPQKAKSFRSDLETVEKMLANGYAVAASVAPSFAAEFSEWQRKRLASALRKLGFKYIGQTSQGAWQVSQAVLRSVKDGRKGLCISTACPALINYVEKYRPELVNYLIPVVSPMIAHGKMLKSRLGQESKVVFIGPCIAKKSEIQRPQNAGIVDAVLTFNELLEWFEKKGINLSACEESNFDEDPVDCAQLFPLPGGLIKSAGLIDNGLKIELVQASGADNIKELLDSVPGNRDYFLLEPLFCSHGCINGPGMNTEKNIFERRQNIIGYSAGANRKIPAVIDPQTLVTGYAAQPRFGREVSESEILNILEQTGKSDPGQRLNCGACGYDSCREKAIAVAQGMAELEMCIPYMRRLAERRTDRIIETSPNGIVILDKDLNMISMNQAFKTFFSCSDSLLGKNISCVIDPAPFEKIAAGMADNIELTAFHKAHKIVCHELFYALRQEKQYAGIFVNVSHLQDNEHKLKQIKSQTLNQAKELLEHQIKMAQNIAMFLGESTARGEELVNKLMALSQDDEEKPNKP
jgi:iron only hydrogenase large subunit-like protein/uncharacterized Fe-S cluster-containing protein